MPQTKVVYPSLRALEGMVAAGNTGGGYSMVRGTLQELYYPIISPAAVPPSQPNIIQVQPNLPFGRAVVFNDKPTVPEGLMREVILPSSDTQKFAGISIINEMYGANQRDYLMGSGYPNMATNIGYPPASPVSILTEGDIWVCVEMLQLPVAPNNPTLPIIDPAPPLVKSGDKVFYRYKLNNAVPWAQLGRFTFDDSNAGDYKEIPNARFISGAVLVEVNPTYNPLVPPAPSGNSIADQYKDYYKNNFFMYLAIVNLGGW